MSSDTLDEAPTTQKKTVELCGDELQKGVRCMLRHGHAGDHEFYAVHASGAITWKRREP